MCSHYQTLKDAEQLLRKFGVTKPGVLGKYDMWPRYQGVFVRRPPEHDAGDEAEGDIEAVTGRWGLISGSTRRTRWPVLRSCQPSMRATTASPMPSPSATLGAARSTASSLPMRSSNLIGAQARPSLLASPGQTVRRWAWPVRAPPPGGQWHESYTMLTINADADPLFRAYHQAGMEKRMVTILPEGAYGDWLHTSAERGRDFLLPIPSDRQTPNLCPHHVLRLSTKTVCDIE
ncbi:Uncharacterised ACR%2C COG2135 [Bordetella trematum]|nr:Uncharacterised ACR%2C COG2135 [Bordetella trematum]SUV97185.1 Uncharacterised ACR, COG2135 [Bordetella trematum]